MLLVSVRVSYSSTPGHAVAVSFRCGKTDTEFPRSKVKLDSAFLRNSGGRSSPFSGHGRVNKSSYVVPLPKQAYGGKSSPVGTFVATRSSPAFEGVYSVCMPSLAFTHATLCAQCFFGYSGTGET